MKTVKVDETNNKYNFKNKKNSFEVIGKENEIGHVDILIVDKEEEVIKYNDEFKSNDELKLKSKMSFSHMLKENNNILDNNLILVDNNPSDKNLIIKNSKNGKNWDEYFSSTKVLDNN